MPQQSTMTGKSLFPLHYPDGLTLLYAPLADCVVEVTESDIDCLIKVMESNEQCADNETNAIVEALTHVVPVSQRPGYVAQAADFQNLTILPTNRCNFACSFCYSRAGRNNDTIDFATVSKTLDYFVSTCAKPDSPLHITLYGGGEPMLSWQEIVRPTLDMIGRLRKSTHVRIDITLITNGSILPPDFVDYLKDCDVDLAVSFEVVRDLQDKHRRNYDKVAENIRTLTAAGINPRINTVITPDSASRLEEIVETLHSNFPRLNYISLEPENAVGLSENFYTEFTNSFFKAHQLAEKYGITATCSALRNCDVTVDRYCAGELALTATGKITLCPCVSAESQPGFSQWIYGHADALKVEIDHHKLHELLSINLQSMPQCSNCFAKYNCGGGCLNNFVQNGNRLDANYCNFMRNFLKRIIRQRYEISNTNPE